MESVVIRQEVLVVWIVSTIWLWENLLGIIVRMYGWGLVCVGIIVGSSRWWRNGNVWVVPVGLVGWLHAVVVI